MTIRVGIVGVGWGTVVHAPAFRLVDGYELVAICARRPESLAKAQAKLGIVDGSTNWRSFVRRDDLDLISVAAPVALHSEVTLAAIVHTKGYRLEIFGSDGTLLATGGRGAEVNVRFGRANDAGLGPYPLSDRMPRGGRPIPPRAAAWAIRSLALMLEDWLPAFDGKPTPVPNLHDGYRVQQVIQAALDSAAGRGWVDVSC